MCQYQPAEETVQERERTLPSVWETAHRYHLKGASESYMHNLHDGECADNVRSIQSIPKEFLPSGAARRALMGMAQDGYDVYARTPLQVETNDTEKRWDIWFNGQCYPLKQWLAEFNKSA